MFVISLDLYQGEKGLTIVPTHSSPTAGVQLRCLMLFKVISLLVFEIECNFEYFTSHKATELTAFIRNSCNSIRCYTPNYRFYNTIFCHLNLLIRTDGVD